jgi:hypothetical protein
VLLLNREQFTRSHASEHRKQHNHLLAMLYGVQGLFDLFCHFTQTIAKLEA